MASDEPYEKWLRAEEKRRIKRMQRKHILSGRKYAQDKERNQRNPIKAAARQKLSRAVEHGKVTRPDRCEQCGVLGSEHPEGLEGHHYDYAKPLDVMWLCGDCHRDWHSKYEPINGDKPMGMMDRFEKFADKTFADAAALYLSEFEGKSRTRLEYALKHAMPYIGDLPLIDVDDQALAQFKSDRRKVAMVGTINKELGTVTAILNKAAKVWRWIPSAPKLQRVKGESRKPYPLSWPEQIAVIGRLMGDTQLVCLFAVNTGCRKEEIFKLRWSDERDIEGVMVFILRDTKNGCDRPVICNSIARRVIGLMRGRDSEKVFPDTVISKEFNAAWRLAGLPDDGITKMGIHNLRHTFGYRLRQAGVAAEDRDSLLGHHSRSLTQHYAIPDIKRLADLAERVTIRNDSPVLR